MPPLACLHTFVSLSTSCLLSFICLWHYCSHCMHTLSWAWLGGRGGGWEGRGMPALLTVRSCPPSHHAIPVAYRGGWRLGRRPTTSCYAALNDPPTS